MKDKKNSKTKTKLIFNQEKLTLEPISNFPFNKTTALLDNQLGSNRSGSFPFIILFQTL